jgi:hypothetical protein
MTPNPMKLKQLVIAAPAVLLIFSGAVANAGETLNDTGAMACVTDKWD